MPKNKKDIEVELRGEIHPTDIPALGRKLLAKGFRLEKRYRRTMAMSFGYVQGVGADERHGKKEWADVRCRLTNGKAEIMCKIGEPDAHNRREISVPISKSDFLRFATMFGSMGFFTKIGTREAVTYRKGKIQVALVKSPSGLAYIELEIMSDRKHEAQALTSIRGLAKELDLKLWPSKKEYFEFCDRLTRRDDWSFKATEKDLKKLAKEIR